MNLAKFGLQIDPRPAQEGAAKTVQAARTIKPALDEVAAASAKVEAATKGAGEAAKRAGEDFVRERTAIAATAAATRTASTSQATLASATQRSGTAAAGSGRAFTALVGSVTRVGGASNQAAGGMSRMSSATAQAASAAGRAAGSFGALAAKVAGVASSFVLLYAGYKTVGAGFSFVSDSIDKASEFEGFQSRWAFFLGSMDAAKAKMKDLADYANSSPFELKGVTEAALLLKNLHGTGLEGMEGLRLVGDAAAKAGKDVSELAPLISRLILNLKSGAGTGEVDPLRNWSILTPKLLMDMQKLGQESKNFPELLGRIKAELAQAKGSTDVASSLWSGLVSSMDDAWSRLKTNVGTPIKDGLKPILIEITEVINEMTEKVIAMGPEIQKFAGYFPVIFRVMRQEGGLQTTLQAAWDWFMAYQTRTWEAIKPVIGAVFEWVAWHFKNALNELSSPAFWDGLVGALTGAINRAIKAAMPTLMTVINGIQHVKVADVGNAGDSFIKSMPVIGPLYEGGKMAGRALTGQPILPDDTAALQDILANPGATDGGLVKTPPPPSSDLFPQPDKPPEIPDYVAPPLETPYKEQSPAEKTFLDLWDTAKRYIDAATQKTEARNDELYKKGAAAGEKARAESDAADAAELAAGPAIKAGSERHEKAMIPGTDMTFDQGQAYNKSMLEKSFTPEEALQAELAKIKAVHEALGTSEADYQKQIAATTAAYETAQGKRAAASEKAAEKEKSQLQQLMASWGNLTKQIDSANVAIMNSIADNITTGLVAMMDGTKSASEAFADMAKGIVSSILQIVTKLIVQYMLMSAMGMASGGFTAFAGKALSSGVMHDGGTVGNATSTRSVPAAVFAGAQRFHSGGKVGSLGSNEVPIIAEKGEMVLTKDQQSDIKKRLGSVGKQEKGSTMTMVNYQDPNDLRAFLAANPDSILNVISAQSGKTKRILGIS